MPRRDFLDADFFSFERFSGRKANHVHILVHPHQDEFERTRVYIENNPVNAQLVTLPATVSGVECKRREKSRRGTHECVRHTLNSGYGARPCPTNDCSDVEKLSDIGLPGRLLESRNGRKYRWFSAGSPRGCPTRSFSSFRVGPPVYFAARDHIAFPAIAANTLRGALGMALREANEYFSPRNVTGPSGFADPPRPFVLRAGSLNNRTLQPGDSFCFDLHLFVLGRHSLDHFHFSVQRIRR